MKEKQELPDEMRCQWINRTCKRLITTSSDAILMDDTNHELPNEINAKVNLKVEKKSMRTQK
jgi:hypothetical protein